MDFDCTRVRARVCVCTHKKRWYENETNIKRIARLKTNVKWNGANLLFLDWWKQYAYDVNTYLFSMFQNSIMMIVGCESRQIGVHQVLGTDIGIGCLC